jgi:hypothetical protein
MTDDIHIHRLRRAWETADSINLKVLVVNTADLRHALERLDKLEVLFEDWQPTHYADVELKGEALEVLRG